MYLIQTYDSPVDIILIPYKANIRNTQQYFPYIYIFFVLIYFKVQHHPDYIFLKASQCLYHFFFFFG